MREFLKGLDLEKELIDTIMAEVGKQHTGLKEQIEDLKKENENYQKNIKELNETIETNNKSLENLQNVTKENTDLKAQVQMSKSNVKDEFSRFVTSEIMAKVDDKNDFASVLESYKKENPQYFGETVVRKVQSSPELAGGTKPRTTNDIMNDILRGSKQ